MHATSVMNSILFVPASRPERFAKALASAAHLVCIDLEDAVAPTSRNAARQAVLAFLPESRIDKLAVRINAVTTRDGLEDLLALGGAPVSPRLMLIPKVEAAAELTVAAGAIDDPHTGLMALVESAEGLAHVVDIARAPCCAAVIFGTGDFTGELAVPMSWDALLAARAAVVQACARAGVPAFDGPYIDIGDEGGLMEETKRVKALGFAGKVAIHPRQVDVINRVFRPTAEEIVEARAAIAAYKASNGAAIQFQGRLLEAPIVRRYERMLVAAGELHA